MRECYNTLSSNFLSIICQVVTKGEKLKEISNFQALKSGRGHLRQVVAYKRFPMSGLVIWLRNFWYFGKLDPEEKWSLTRGRQPDVWLYYSTNTSDPCTVFWLVITRLHFLSFMIIKTSQKTNSWNLISKLTSFQSINVLCVHSQQQSFVVQKLNKVVHVVWLVISWI